MKVEDIRKSIFIGKLKAINLRGGSIIYLYYTFILLIGCFSYILYHHISFQIIFLINLIIVLLVFFNKYASFCKPQLEFTQLSFFASNHNQNLAQGIYFSTKPDYQSVISRLLFQLLHQPVIRYNKFHYLLDGKKRFL